MIISKYLVLKSFNGLQFNSEVLGDLFLNFDEEFCKLTLQPGNIFIDVVLDMDENVNGLKYTQNLSVIIQDVIKSVENDLTILKQEILKNTNNENKDENKDIVCKHPEICDVFVNCDCFEKDKKDKKDKNINSLDDIFKKPVNNSLNLEDIIKKQLDSKINSKKINVDEILKPMDVIFGQLGPINKNDKKHNNIMSIIVDILENKNK